ncbi:MAG: outer membrane protein assembly factor BamE [Pseudomonadota bacterium]|jgi:outer membrane protein assembly factor BamE|nr:outer membrane protein assembly factor BamE [Pseudomonadota bacterium]|tara:strand:- start:649 stop:960 length:312 start_codon:yes stop_codon:yes gene_type:complete
MKKILIIIISLLIYSCSNTNLYKVTITQGTVFAQEDIDKLEIGMTKDQVSFVMGQPSFENFFEKNVWNYIYKITTGDNVDMEKKVKLIFDEKNLLSEVVIIKI